MEPVKKFQVTTMDKKTDLTTDVKKGTYWQFDVVVADPPWAQKKGGIRKKRPYQNRNLDYKTLSIEEIKRYLARIDTKILFLWTIDKFLFEAEDIAKELGYKLHSRIIWNKTNGIAPAFTLRFSKEYLLWFYKSPMLQICKNQRGKFTDIITEKSTKHSQKPSSAYDMIELLYPNTRKLDMFARKKRNGWDVFGDEVEDSIQLQCKKVSEN